MCIFFALAYYTCAYKLMPWVILALSTQHVIVMANHFWNSEYMITVTFVITIQPLQTVQQMAARTKNSYLYSKLKKNKYSEPTYVAIFALQSHVNCHLGNLDEIKTRFDCGASPMPWPLHPRLKSTLRLILTLRCTNELDMFLP